MNRPPLRGHPGNFSAGVIQASFADELAGPRRLSVRAAASREKAAPPESPPQPAAAVHKSLTSDAAPPTGPRPVRGRAKTETREAPATTALPASFLAQSPAQPGHGLSPIVLRKMESIFGEDFSAVRVHVGLQAQSLGAVACTAGSNIYFAPGRFQPTTPEGEHLLVCQLIRVLQQRSGRVKNPFGTGLALVRDAALDEEAQRMSRSLLAPRGGTGRRRPQSARRGASPTESAVSQGAPGPHREGRKLTEEAFARFVEENGARIDQVVAMDGALEAWLQVEYALALSSRHDATHIKLEEPGIYPGDHRPDITLSIGDTSYLIEIRCEAPRETAQAFVKRVQADVEKLKKLATPHVKVLIAYALKDATARLIRADKDLLDLMGIATGFVAATKQHEKAQVFQAVYL